MTHGSPGRHVTVGVDTHKDVHVAVALDGLGADLGEPRLPTTPAGYTRLEHRAAEFGPIEAFGIEGTGCHGAGPTRFLEGVGHRVGEASRPDRSPGTARASAIATRSMPIWRPARSCPASRPADPRPRTTAPR